MTDRLVWRCLIGQIAAIVTNPDLADHILAAFVINMVWFSAFFKQCVRPDYLCAIHVMWCADPSGRVHGY